MDKHTYKQTAPLPQTAEGRVLFLPDNACRQPKRQRKENKIYTIPK